MPKSSVAVYIDPILRERIKKAMLARQRISPPGWKSISSYTAHLVEEGLRQEEAFLIEEQNKESRRKKDDAHIEQKKGASSN